MKTTIVSDQRVGMRPCTSFGLSPLYEFRGDLKIICSRLFNASVETIFKHQIDEMKQSNLPSHLSPQQNEIIRTTSETSLLTDEEDSCVTPKENQASSKPAAAVRIDHNDDQNQSETEKYILKGKNLSQTFQFYCKSALNRSLDSFGIKLTINFSLF